MNIHKSSVLLMAALLSMVGATQAETPLPDQRKETNRQEGPGTEGAKSATPGTLQQTGQTQEKSKDSQQQGGAVDLGQPCDEMSPASGGGESRGSAPDSRGSGY
jgi:hypothetical protein